MIDTHAHLSSRFGRKKGDIDGLEYVILAASSVKDSEENINLAKEDKRLLASVGIHPQEISREVDKQISSLEELLKKNKKIVAVGECGLEFVGEVDKNLQIKFFEKQIELSQKYDKALIVHSRKAIEETLEVLKKYKNLRGVIHCYSGGKKKIKEFLELGENWFFGIDGNLTYEEGVVEVVRNIPKDRLVLETDSPFLAPKPHRGEENKPTWIKSTYEKVAEIWGESFEKTEEIIDANAQRLFKII